MSAHRITLPQPPFAIPDATRDETAPHQPQVRGEVGTEDRRWLAHVERIAGPRRLLMRDSTEAMG